MNLMIDTTLWIKRPVHTATATARLLCLPFVGSGASAFRPWALALAPTIEVLAVVLPGRESRRRETPLTQFEDILDSLFEAVVDILAVAGPPLSLFGHSMGALLAFELSHRLRDHLGIEPSRLFVAGQLPPDLIMPLRISDLPQGAFIQRLRAFGGTPVEVFEHEELLSALIPVLRADFQAYEHYEYRVVPRLACPITAFAGSDDANATSDSLEHWARFTSGNFRLNTMKGDHFFIHSSRADIMHTIQSELTSFA
jgi:medium-chain acyl-[acyl-carrier-protein] hydrolase